MIIHTTRDSETAKKGGGFHFAPGFYRAAIVEAEDTTSKTSGNPMVKMVVQIESPEGDETIYIDYYLPLTQTMLWKTENTIAACGVVFSKGQDIDVQAALFRGRKCAVRLFRRANVSSGKLYLDIDQMMSPERVPHFGEFSPDEYAKFRLNGDGTKNGNGSQSGPAPVKAAPPVLEDDDIPF